MSEEMIVRHCSPTLAGIKTGSLFSCPAADGAALRDSVRRWNRFFSAKGLRMIPLRHQQGLALVYVYRPSQLQRDLKQSTTRQLLDQRGYRPEAPDLCVAHLIRRLAESDQFPHEIGLFLGYPPEDVRGFIEQGGRACKCSGLWKVYDDEHRAQKLFDQYRKCTRAYRKLLAMGKSLDRITVAG